MNTWNRPGLARVFGGVLVAAALIALAASPVTAQDDRFGDLADGPYDRLVIRNAMVIPGHGGPPVGPYDIVIEGNTIAEMTPFDPVTAERRGDAERASGDRVIDATGMYVMPGMVDLHMHLRGDALPLEYTYYLKLAHGVTTLVPAEEERLAEVDHGQRSADNDILAPRLFPIHGWGNGTSFTRAEREDPALAPQVADRKSVV